MRTSLPPAKASIASSTVSATRLRRRGFATEAFPVLSPRPRTEPFGFATGRAVGRAGRCVPAGVAGRGALGGGAVRGDPGPGERPVDAGRAEEVERPVPVARPVPVERLLERPGVA